MDEEGEISSSITIDCPPRRIICWCELSLIWPGFDVSAVCVRAGAKGVRSNSGGGQGGSALGYCTITLDDTDVRTVSFIYSDSGLSSCYFAVKAEKE